MATIKVYDEDPEDISCICGLLDPDLEGILLGYGREDNKELEREMVSECEKPILLNAREKIFVLAKEKIIKCLSKQEAGKPTVVIAEKETHDEARLIKSCVQSWQLVPRRAEHKIAHDVIMLIDFNIGNEVIFPSKLIKEASTNKGNLGDDDSTTDLIARLAEDLETAKDNVEINLVEESGSTQIHSISIAAQGSDVNQQPSDDRATNKQAAAVVAENPSVEIAQSGGADSGSATATPSDDSNKPCDCEHRQAKEVKDMACQTEEERPISSAEFDFQADYNERKTRVNGQNIKWLIKWKSLVNDRLGKIEKMHEREIIDLRAIVRTLSVDVAGNTRKCRQNPETVNSGKPKEKQRQTNKKVDIVDMWDGDATGDDESVWDLPKRQSTPGSGVANKKGSTLGRSGGTTKDLGKGVQRSDQLANQEQRKAQNRNRQSIQPIATKRVKGSKQGSYRVDIEMMDVQGEVETVSSSSDSEEEPPRQKKARQSEPRAERGDRQNDQSKAGGNKQVKPIATRLKALAETSTTNDVEMEDDDSSWAEMVDEPMEEESGDESRSAPRAQGRREPKSGPKKTVQFTREPAARGTKRSGPPQPPAKKNGESDTRTYGNSSSEGDENSSENEQDSFAEVVEKNSWKTMGKYNKWEKSVAAKRHCLKGVRSILQKELYIQGLDFKGFESYTEMEQLIQEYCNKRSVPIIFMKIIPTKFDKTQVGCKLAVKEEDAEKVMGENFWPEYTTVREWVRKPRNLNGGGDYAGPGYQAY